MASSKFRNESISEGFRVDCYRNLNFADTVWSVRGMDRRSLSALNSYGRVVRHSGTVTLTDCVFVVGSKGRERVLREGHKNVHAMVRGHWAPQVDAPSGQDFLEVVYDPWSADYFYTTCEKREVVAADIVVLTDVVRAWGVTHLI